MDTKRRLFCVLFTLSLVLALPAQTLMPSSAAVTLDGRIGASEYPYLASYAGMRLGLALSADGTTLFAAVEAPATGWVALGLGSSRMNGAYMVMGSVSNGQPGILEQEGVGFGHRAVSGTKIVKSAVREEGGKTVLELQLRAADFVKAGSLPLILAFSKNDNPGSRHAGRAGLELRIGN